MNTVLRMPMREFAVKIGNSTVGGTEFSGWDLPKLEAEHSQLTAPSPVNPSQLKVCNHLAGGVQRAELLEKIIAFMRHNGFKVWEPEKRADDDYTRSLKASMAAEDKRMGSMPKALADLLQKHKEELAGVDAMAGMLEEAVASVEATEAAIREAVYELGAGSKDLRLALDQPFVRDAVRRRFGGDGRGKARDSVMASARTAIHQLILSRFKKAAA